MARMRPGPLSENSAPCYRLGMTTRIYDQFDRLNTERRVGLVTFIMAGDPDPETSFAILEALPSSGADVIELGMPFTDPMADGPAIQAAGLRALQAGQTLSATLEMVARFRALDALTPIVLMGYFNPIYVYGVKAFLADARGAGVDGVIVVDCPPEEDDELCIPAIASGLAFIRLVTPTTDDKRLPAVVTNATGFLYYVSVTGVTGSLAPDPKMVAASVQRIRQACALPIAVGFGIKDAVSAEAIAALAEGIVVGSAIAEAIRSSLDEGNATSATVPIVRELVERLALSCRKSHHRERPMKRNRHELDL